MRHRGHSPGSEGLATRLRAYPRVLRTTPWYRPVAVVQNEQCCYTVGGQLCVLGFVEGEIVGPVAPGINGCPLEIVSREGKLTERSKLVQGAGSTEHAGVVNAVLAQISVSRACVSSPNHSPSSSVLNA